MPWFVMAAAVPKGTQIIALEGFYGNFNKAEAIKQAAIEIRKEYRLPSSYTILPQFLASLNTKEEAQEFIDRLHKLMEKEGKNNAQA